MIDTDRAYDVIIWIYTHCGHFDTLIFALPIILFVTMLYLILRMAVQRHTLRDKIVKVRKAALLNEIIKLLAVCWLITLLCLTLTRTEAWKDFWIYIIHSQNPFVVFLPTRYGEINLMPTILRYILNGRLDWLLWSAKSIFPQLFLNIVLFVPLGLAMPFIYKKYSFFKVALTGLSLSLLIEFIQFFIGRECEIDDLICNTLGSIIGYLMYLLLKKLFPQFVEKGKITAKEVWLKTIKDDQTDGEASN